MAYSRITSWQIDGEKVETVTNFILLGSKITVDGDCSHEIKRYLFLGRKAMTNLDKSIKKQRHHSADKGPYRQSYGFSSSHEWMWELDYKEGWVLKNWCFSIVVLEKTPESPLDSKEIKSVNLEGNQPWILIGRVGRNWCWSSSILVIWCEDPTHWKSPWCWGKLRAEREEGVRGWNGWVASPMQWTWIWTNFRRWWGTSKLGVLQSMGWKESDMTEWLNNNEICIQPICSMWSLAPYRAGVWFLVVRLD